MISIRNDGWLGKIGTCVSQLQIAPAESTSCLISLLDGRFFAFGAGSRTCLGKSESDRDADIEFVSKSMRHRLDGTIQARTYAAFPL